MIILALRTDKPEAELYVIDISVIGRTYHKERVCEIRWQAHLKLAESLNSQIDKILNKSSISYKDLGGIAIYKGPGSFTGLRIGMSVANALAYAQHIPVVARAGAGWLERAAKDLAGGHNDQIAVPNYGAPARVTKPKK